MSYGRREADHGHALPLGAPPARADPAAIRAAVLAAIVDHYGLQAQVVEDTRQLDALVDAIMVRIAATVWT